MTVWYPNDEVLSKDHLQTISEHAASRSSGGEWGKGQGRSQCIYYILELFLHMTMLLEVVPVYTKACNINFI